MRWTRVRGLALLVVALVIGLALSVGLWGHWTASAQDTFLVNDDTTPADGGCGTPDFQTEDIEDAIDSGLVADGDTLVICEGTYNPLTTIEVAKAVTIEGRAAADRADVLVQGIAGNHGIEIQADGVTIRHLTLTGPVADIAGINIVVGANDNTIQDMEISGWNDGIRIDDADNNTVEMSNIHTNTDDGIQAQYGANNVFRNNTISNNQTAIDLTKEDGTLVDGNTLFDNDRNQIRIDGRSYLRIERNTITTLGDGIGIVSGTAETLIIIGGSPDKANTFTGTFGDPIYYVELDCASENTVDATYNWWGTTNSIDIANRIFNDENDTGAECPFPDHPNGAVVFHRWATGPAPTPTPSPTPTTTGTPTPTATGTPTPTATPGATRTVNLSPQGWHNLGWSGPDATDPATALACISGDYSIAYAWEGPTVGFRRHVEGCAIEGICNMGPLDKYDSVLVNITAADVSCTMPVAP